MHLSRSQASASLPLRRGNIHRILVPAEIVLLALCARLSFVLATDFPLQDGGLFYTMIRDLQEAGFALPWFTSYNSAGIPFAYPPLGFYLAGLIDVLTPGSLFEVLRFLPLAMSLASLVAFYFLARTMLASEAQANLAMLAFALLPEVFRWLIMGGGLTRSLGLLFAILAIRQAYLLYTDPSTRHVLLTIAFAGCTVLSHPELAYFAAYSIALVYLMYARDRAGLLRSVVVATGTLLVSAPWWAIAIARHGLAAFQVLVDDGWTWYWGLIRLLLLQVTAEPFFPVLGVVALLGLLACLRQRQLFLPLWVLSIFVVQARGPFAKATVPLALLFGIGVTEVLLPFLNGTARVTAERWKQAGQAVGPQPGRVPHSRLAQAVVALIVIYAIFAVTVSERALVTSLSVEERAAMRWVADNTPTSSRFLVVTSDRWGIDRTSEWFPALAERISITTPQGAEWLPEFSPRTHRANALQECAAEDAACLEAWAQEWEVAFTHVYVGKRSANSEVPSDRDPCRSLRQSLLDDPQYEMLYDNPGATVYRRIEAGPVSGLEQRTAVRRT